MYVLDEGTADEKPDNSPATPGRLRTQRTGVRGSGMALRTRAEREREPLGPFSYPRGAVFPGDTPPTIGQWSVECHTIT